MKFRSFSQQVSGPDVLHTCGGSRFRVSFRSPVRASFRANRDAWTICGPTDRICDMIILLEDDVRFTEA